MKRLPSLSDAEKEIMKIIWNSGGSVYISALLEKVEVREWKRTTVCTFLKRLTEKGYIRAERRGRLCEYVARVGEEEYLSQQVECFVDDVFGGSVDGMLASLFSRKSMHSDELRRLEAYWNRGREEMK